MENVLPGLLLFAFLILFIVTGLAHAFWPRWAVKQPWSAFNEKKLKQQFSLFNMRYEPTELRIRSVGVGILSFITLVLWVLFGDRDSPHLKSVWSLWVTVVVTLTAFQCFVWAFSPRWLVSRFPSLADGIPTSRVGRIAMRTLGILGLTVTAVIVVGYTAW